jgi:hypothetical protein
LARENQRASNIDSNLLPGNTPADSERWGIEGAAKRLAQAALEDAVKAV